AGDVFGPKPATLWAAVEVGRSLVSRSVRVGEVPSSNLGPPMEGPRIAGPFLFERRGCSFPTGARALLVRPEMSAPQAAPRRGGEVPGSNLGTPINPQTAGNALVDRGARPNAAKIGPLGRASLPRSRHSRSPVAPSAGVGKRIGEWDNLVRWPAAAAASFILGP